MSGASANVRGERRYYRRMGCAAGAGALKSVRMLGPPVDLGQDGNSKAQKLEDLKSAISESAVITTHSMYVHGSVVGGWGESARGLVELVEPWTERGLSGAGTTGRRRLTASRRSSRTPSWWWSGTARSTRPAKCGG